MDLADQAFQILVSGADQGATKAVALGTTAAAVSMWSRIKTHFQGRTRDLDSAEVDVLTAEPGEEVDAEALRRLLEMLTQSPNGRGMIVHGDYVARDKTVFNFDTR